MPNNENLLKKLNSVIQRVFLEEDKSFLQLQKGRPDYVLNNNVITDKDRIGKLKD